MTAAEEDQAWADLTNLARKMLDKEARPRYRDVLLSALQIGGEDDAEKMACARFESARLMSRLMLPA